MSQQNYHRRSSDESFWSRAIGKFIMTTTAAGIIFGSVTYLDSIRQQGADALRIANEAKTIAIETKQEMKDKADKSDIQDLKQDIRSFRELYEKNAYKPDVVIRYRDRKLK